MKNNSQHRRTARTIRLQLLVSCIAFLALMGFGSLPAGVPVDAGASAASASQSTQDTDSSAACPTCSAPANTEQPHLLAATYYSLRHHLRATLMLNNKGPWPLDVQPTLFGVSGARRFFPTVTVPGNSFREIDLREWVAGDESFREGSLQVSYNGADLMLGAQVYLVDSERSLVFEENWPSRPYSSRRLVWKVCGGCRLVIVMCGSSFRTRRTRPCR